MKAILLIAALIAIAESARADFLPSSFSTEYEESYISSVTGKEKKSFGRIDYKYPRHIRYEVLSPDPSSFVANPRTSWHYTPAVIEGESGQVVVQKSDDLVLTKFLDALKNGTKSNAAYSVKVDGPRLVLNFSSTMKKELRMTQAVLVGTGDAGRATNLGDFKELWLHHQDGKKVKIVFVKFHPGISFPADHFEFHIPPKTKVTQGK